MTEEKQPINQRKECVSCGRENEPGQGLCKDCKREANKRYREKQKRKQIAELRESLKKEFSHVCYKCSETRYPFVYLEKNRGYCKRCFDKMSQDIAAVNIALDPEHYDVPF